MSSQLLLLGIIGGALGGLLGIGGGTIYIPILVIFYHMSQHMAQGVALAVMIPMSLIGGYAYLRKGSVQKELLFELMIGSVIGATFGATIATHIDGILLRKIFSCILVFFGLKMLFEKGA